MRGGVPPRALPRPPRARARPLSQLSPNIQSKVKFFQRQPNIQQPQQSLSQQKANFSLTGAKGDRINYKDYTGSTNVKNRINIYNKFLRSRKIVNENKKLSKHQKSLFLKLPNNIQARLTLDHNMKTLQDIGKNQLLQYFIKTNNIDGINYMFPEKLPTIASKTTNNLPNRTTENTSSLGASEAPF